MGRHKPEKFKDDLASLLMNLKNNAGEPYFIINEINNFADKWDLNLKPQFLNPAGKKSPEKAFIEFATDPEAWQQSFEAFVSATDDGTNKKRNKKK